MIVTGWGAAPGFLPQGYPYLVDHELVATTTDEPDAVLHPCEGERWAKAEVWHVATELRHLYEHRDEGRAWGRRAQAHVSINFDSVSVTRRLVAVLDGRWQSIVG